MESLQKAVAKELLKRQRQADAHLSKATQPPVIQPIGTQATDDPDISANPVTSQTTDSGVEAESTPKAESIPSATEPVAADPWFPDEQTLLTAIERARPQGKKKTLSNSDTTEPQSTSETPESSFGESSPSLDKADSSSPSTPYSPSTPTNKKEGSDLPDAYQQLLQSSLQHVSDSQPQTEEDGSTPHPFGRQRKRRQVPEPDNDKDSGAKRRSLRGWFTPGREADADETDD